MSGLEWVTAVSLLSQVSFITVVSSTLQLSLLPVPLAVSKSVLPSPSPSPSLWSVWNIVLPPRLRAPALSFHAGVCKQIISLKSSLTGVNPTLVFNRLRLPQHAHTHSRGPLIHERHTQRPYGWTWNCYKGAHALKKQVRWHSRTRAIHLDVTDDSQWSTSSVYYHIYTVGSKNNGFCFRGQERTFNLNS